MATASRATACQHHAVAVPLAAQGHLNPLMRLCTLLASQYDFLITFVNVDVIHTRLLRLQHQNQQVVEPASGPETHGGSRIRLAHVAVPALDLSNDFRLSLEHFLEAVQHISEGLESLVRDISPPATCIISDVCMTSPTQLVADRVGIPRVVLFPSSQFFQMFCYHLLNGRLPEASTMARDCTPKTYRDPAHEGQLDGLVPLTKRDLPCLKHVVDDTEYVYRFLVRECKLAYERVHALVVNTFPELESDAIRAYKELQRKPPLYAVGPLIENLTDETCTSLWKEDDGCMEWLDKQPPKSVMYISFGSITLLSQSQFDHLLSALESSNQRFLWSFRPDLVKGAMATIPEGFLRVVDGRGYIATWVPQLSVLKHPSTGAFLTHCGWNSTMEAIATGVPMLCWPYFGDQFMDAKYIVEVWKVGMAFQYSSDGSEVIAKEEIERTIRAVMEGEEGKVVRENAAGLKEAARKCHEEGGSLRNSLEAFVLGLP